MSSGNEPSTVSERFREEFLVYSDYIMRNFPREKIPLWLVYENPIEVLLVEEPYE